MIRVLLLGFILLISFASCNEETPQRKEMTLCEKLMCSQKGVELYKKDYKKTFQLLNDYVRSLDLCSSKSKEFLEVVKFIKSNVELQEYFSEYLEKQLLRKSSCFVGRMTELGANDKKDILKLLENPTYYPKEVSEKMKELKTKF